MSHVYFNSSNAALFEDRFSRQRKTLIEYCGNPSLRHLKAMIQNGTGNDADVAMDMFHLANHRYGHALNVFWRISCLILLLSTVIVIVFYKKRRISSTRSDNKDQVSEEIHLIHAIITFLSI